VTETQTFLSEQAALFSQYVVQYEITFLSSVGNIEALIVDSALVHNTAIIYDGDNSVDMFGFKNSISLPGERPVDYATSGLLSNSLRSFEIKGLSIGLEYYVYVRAINKNFGYGSRMQPQPPSVQIVFKQPRSPVNVVLSVNTNYSYSLLVSYSPAEDDGGSPILRYRVELDPSPDFYRPIVKEIKCPTSSKKTVWKVETYIDGTGKINGGSYC
jgi:hypothetical protein